MAAKLRTGECEVSARSRLEDVTGEEEAALHDQVRVQHWVKLLRNGRLTL